MPIPPALAAEIAILTEALDSGSDLSENLHRLAADVRSAVPSYLGLTLTLQTGDPPLRFTMLGDGVLPEDVRTTVLIPLSAAASGAAVILFAGQLGAFVDLTADLCWLTSRELGDFALDRRLTAIGKSDTTGSVRIASLINQAVGMLIGQGHTPELARRELDARAAHAGTNRHGAAELTLADTSSVDPIQPVDAR